MPKTLYKASSNQTGITAIQILEKQGRYNINAESLALTISFESEQARNDYQKQSALVWEVEGNKLGLNLIKGTYFGQNIPTTYSYEQILELENLFEATNWESLSSEYDDESDTAMQQLQKQSKVEQSAAILAKQISYLRERLNITIYKILVKPEINAFGFHRLTIYPLEGNIFPNDKDKFKFEGYILRKYEARDYTDLPQKRFITTTASLEDAKKFIQNLASKKLITPTQYSECLIALNSVTVQSRIESMSYREGENNSRVILETPTEKDIKKISDLKDVNLQMKKQDFRGKGKGKGEKYRHIHHQYVVIEAQTMLALKKELARVADLLIKNEILHSEHKQKFLQCLPGELNGMQKLSTIIIEKIHNIQLMNLSLETRSKMLESISQTKLAKYCGFETFKFIEQTEVLLENSLKLSSIIEDPKAFEAFFKSSVIQNYLKTEVCVEDEDKEKQNQVDPSSNNNNNSSTLKRGSGDKSQKAAKKQRLLAEDSPVFSKQLTDGDVSVAVFRPTK